MDIKLNVIKDSRGHDTLEVSMNASGYVATASVPAGKSTGTHEAIALEPWKAVNMFEQIRPAIKNQEEATQKEFDSLLCELDGTENKSHLGANLTLALSLAFARIKSQQAQIPLWQFIASNTEKKGKNKFPRPFFNVINGGVHVKVPSSWQDAKGRLLRLDFQEFQITPSTDEYDVGLATAQEAYRKLKNELEKKFGTDHVRMGDEAGFFAPFKSNYEALECIHNLCEKSHYPLAVGMDAAASQMYESGLYRVEKHQIDASELKKLYESIIDEYGVVALEDPFDEEDFNHFAQLTKEAKDIHVITDDLTTTNTARLATAIEKKAGNTLLVKPNQIGTLTETLEAVSMAHKNGWETMVSHRSGETEDSFIADLAVGIGAWGFKSGAPATVYRMNKYNRLLQIYQEEK